MCGPASRRSGSITAALGASFGKKTLSRLVSLTSRLPIRTARPYRPAALEDFERLASPCRLTLHDLDA